MICEAFCCKVNKNALDIHLATKEVYSSEEQTRPFYCCDFAFGYLFTDEDNLLSVVEV